MLQLPALGALSTILLVIAISGVVSWGIAQIIKSAVLWYEKTHHDKWWFALLIRAAAIVSGAILGYFLLPGIVGLGLGAGGGVLNTTIVAIVKSRLKGVKPDGSVADAPIDPVEPDEKDPSGGA